MTHTFQFDPNTILGVSSGASLHEIRDAYHQKSLKHHPDKGGDEWAFRMVVRAYEILSTARVVNRASPPPTMDRRATPRPEPAPRPSWSSRFRPGGPTADGASAAPFSSGVHSPFGAAAGATASAEMGPTKAAAPNSASASMADREATNLSGWGGVHRPHTTQALAELAHIVAVELLILRFELECSLDLFARSPEDRNLSCTLHITWPIEELVERREPIADAAKTLDAINEAFKNKAVRKHALTKRSHGDGGQFVGWLTYPTAVMASEALEAFREALVGRGITVEKQVREMALPRQW